MKRPIKREGQEDNSVSLAAVCCPPFSGFLHVGREGDPVCLSVPTKRSSSGWGEWGLSTA